LQLRYLDGVWQHPRAKQTYNNSSFAELHKLQVQLYAKHQPKRLRAFLQSSEHYDLRRAYDVCQSTTPTPMHQEMVYILSRLGNTKEALALIIEELEDVPQAIEFIKNSHDASLWSDLVDRSLKSPRFIAGLLGNIGTAVMMEKDQGVDPAQLISKIPMGMRVPGLRDKLVKIISDYTMQLQLRESCNLVLKADCFELLKKLCYQQRRAMRVVTDPQEISLRQSLQSVQSQRGIDGSSSSSSSHNSHGRGHSKTDSTDFMNGSKRRATSVGSVSGFDDIYDVHTMHVSFSDKICYPGHGGVHTTRQPVGGSGSGGQGGGQALPRFG